MALKLDVGRCSVLRPGTWIINLFANRLMPLADARTSKSISSSMGPKSKPSRKGACPPRDSLILAVSKIYILIHHIILLEILPSYRIFSHSKMDHFHLSG